MKKLTEQQIKRIERDYAISIGGNVALVKLFEEIEQAFKKQLEDFISEVMLEISSIKSEITTLPSKAAKEVKIPIQDRIIEKTNTIIEKPLITNQIVREIIHDFDSIPLEERLKKIEDYLKNNPIQRNIFGGRAGIQVLGSGTKVGTKTNEINFVGPTVTDSYGRITVTTTGSFSKLTPSSGSLGQGTFVWSTAPSIIVRDGVSIQKTSTDETVNWTGTTTTVLTIYPTFDIFGF